MEFSSLMDTPRFFTALAEWSGCLVYILLLKKRHSAQKLTAILTFSLLSMIAYQLIAGMLPLYLWIPGMIGTLALMFFLILYTTDTTWQDAGFCCIRAFVLAEFTASLHWQLYVWWAVGHQQDLRLLSFLFMLVLYPASYVIYYFLERNHIPKEQPMYVGNKELSGAFLIGVSAFIMSNISFIMPNTPFSSVTYSILYVRTLVDFGGLVTLFAQQDKREELRMKNENHSMNVVLQRQYDQYRLSVNNMELLRREFHDLKHYMLAIRSEQDPEKKEQYLSEMEDAILLQEAFCNTGNSVLDVVLTTKSTYCTQNNINFTCMADGKLISFMHVKDICSIFGNALDNAIECATQFEDPQKRLISLSLNQKNQFLLILFENYSENPLHLEREQLPSTTKNDTFFHGYGLKSIRHATEKYGGTMTLSCEHNWFTLQILIPIPTFHS